MLSAKTYPHDEEGRFMVLLPKRPMENKLGESHSQSVCHFLSFERSIHDNGIFTEV